MTIQARLLVSVVGSAVCGVLLGACAQTAARPTTLQEIARRGELRASYHVEPPSVIRDSATAELRGAFISAIRSIASSLGVKPVFVEVDLANYAASLLSGESDVSLGPTFKTTERARTVAFTTSLYFLGYTAVVRRDSAPGFPDDASVNKPTVRVAVRQGSPIFAYAKQHYPTSQFVVTTGSDLTLPLRAVSDGTADIGFMNEHTVEAYVSAHPEVATVFADAPRQMGGMAWAVRPDDQEWLNFLNSSLEYLISSGQMSNWEKESFEGRSLRRSWNASLN